MRYTLPLALGLAALAAAPLTAQDAATTEPPAAPSDPAVPAPPAAEPTAVPPMNTTVPAPEASPVAPPAPVTEAEPAPAADAVPATAPAPAVSLTGEQKAAYDSWDVGTKTYFDGLTPVRQAIFLRIADADKAKLVALDAAQQEQVWASLEKQNAAQQAATPGN